MGMIHRPHYTTASAWLHDETAFRALAYGAGRLGDDPLPDDGDPEPAKITCPVCSGLGALPVFAGHGLPPGSAECRQCWGEGEVDPRELP
jgi:hypothetical protein